MTDKELVQTTVMDDYRTFKKNLLKKPKREIYDMHYRIFVTEQLTGVLVDCEHDDDLYTLLVNKYRVRVCGHLLPQLFDEYICDENASVNTYDDTIYFLRNCVR